MADSLVIIPTYNECENIENIINAVFDQGPAFDVLVVDDGSPDGTGSIVKRMQQKHGEKLALIEREGKLGLGTAYIRGFNYGLSKGYDYILEMDADFSHNPKDLIRLREECLSGKADLCIGSRYIKGGEVKNWSLDRHFWSRGASIYVQLITQLPVKDSTAGFVCYSRTVLEKINLQKIQFIGYAFQIEMKWAAHTLGFKIKEIPITFVDRVLGTSKMNMGIVKEGIFGVIQMKVSSMKKKSRYSLKLA